MWRDSYGRWQVMGGVGDAWGMLLVLLPIVIDEPSRCRT